MPAFTILGKTSTATAFSASARALGSEACSRCSAWVESRAISAAEAARAAGDQQAAAPDSSMAAKSAGLAMEPDRVIFMTTTPGLRATGAEKGRAEYRHPPAGCQS